MDSGGGIKGRKIGNSGASMHTIQGKYAIKMLYQIDSQIVDTLLLNNYSEREKFRIRNYLSVHPCEKIVLGWNLFRGKQSNRSFLVTNRKIRFGKNVTKKRIPSIIDMSDVISVKFDGIFCFNIFTVSNYPNAYSVPANYFFDASYNALSVEQKTILVYICSIIVCLNKCI